MELPDNRLIKTFDELRSDGKKAMIPFLTAGYPDAETTAAMLRDVESRGVRICELGIAFSDPIADGPVIQASFTRALEAGITVQKVFDMVKAYRAGGGRLALLAMLSFSIVQRHGTEAFCRKAAEAGFDGVIVPDLPVEEQARLAPTAKANNLCNVTLISPTTPADRRISIARAATGFVYFMSIAGITGERDKLPAETYLAVAELKTHVETPICVGFGISKPETVAQVCKAGDGAIVGSAIIHRINDAIGEKLPAGQIVRKVGEFVSQLMEPIK